MTRGEVDSNLDQKNISFNFNYSLVRVITISNTYFTIIIQSSIILFLHAVFLLIYQLLYD